MQLSLGNGVKVFYQFWEASIPDLSQESHSNGMIDRRLVTLINGHTRSSSDFKMFSRRLRESGYSSLAIDNRGSGNTVCTDSFTLEDMASDIVAVWDLLGIRNSHIVGISMGGWISQYLARYHPHRVLSTTLVSTCSSKEFIRPDGSEWGHSLDEIITTLNPYFSDRFLRQNHLLIQAMAKQIKSVNENGGFSHNAKRQRHAMKQFSLEGLATSIRCPTLVIHGADDKIINVNAASKIHDDIAGSELHIVPDAGHLLLAECPKVIYEKVVAFLLKHDHSRR